MREVIVEIESWRKEGKKIGIATNVRKVGSSLRPLGAKMAMTADGKIAGSITGGCIEGAVYQEAQAVIGSGIPKLLHYGVTSQETPWEIGLSCGGSLDVLVESLDSPSWQALYPALRTCITKDQPAAVATVITGGKVGNKLLMQADGQILGSLGTAALDTDVAKWVRGQMDIQETNWKCFDTLEVFVDILPSLPRLVVVGAVHLAIPLVSMAKILGYHTVVIDPRESFATRDRFPHVDELITDWPADALENLCLDKNTYVAVISHDEKLDNPALKVALSAPTRFVGVLGSKKSIATRIAALRELDVTGEQLARLQAPIGMRMGAASPQEIALSILAAMVAAKNGVLEIQPGRDASPESLIG